MQKDFLKPNLINKMFTKKYIKTKQKNIVIGEQLTQKWNIKKGKK